MTTVVRLGPLPLERRRASSVAELERILGTAVQLVEVFSVAELVTALGHQDVVAVAVDAPPPSGLTEAVAVAGSPRSCDLSGDYSATPVRKRQPPIMYVM